MYLVLTRKYKSSHYYVTEIVARFADYEEADLFRTLYREKGHDAIVVDEHGLINSIEFEW